MKALIEFTVPQDREVDETNTRVEEGKTITETVKVKRTINIPFLFKKPSRAQREDAELERAVWETKFITAGILPQALLLKTYANYGGILSDDQKINYRKLQADYLLAEAELKRLQANDRDNKAAIEAEAIKLVTLRQDILDFQQEQSVFFENTAESKSRQKLIEWYVLHLTYWKPTKADGSNGEWTPYFAGETTAAKLASFDAILDARDEIWGKARETIELMATAYAAGGEEDAEAIAKVAQEAK